MTETLTLPVLPAINFTQPLPANPMAWRDFLRRQAPQWEAIGILNDAGQRIAVVISAPAAVAMFPNPLKEGWPRCEAFAWMEAVQLCPFDKSLVAAWNDMTTGKLAGRVHFLANWQGVKDVEFRGLLLDAADYARLRAPVA